MRAHVSNRSGNRDASGPNNIGPEGPPASPSMSMDALAAASTDAADPFALVPLLALSGDGEAALPADRAAFVDWAALARRLAGAQGKAVRVEAVLDPFPRLPPERAAMLRDVGMELVANAVLHGIEPMSARRRLGKDPVGAVRLTLGFDEREGWLFCVRDDGRGVDLARLREALVSGGACTPAEAARLSERETIVKVFEPGVTTAMQAEGARGHGLGLPNAVERLRGLQARVSLVTVPGRSTEVRIAWPPG
ncbi:signal transduction histidine kinase [Lysobacter enzymogenes]|uniref:Signal transduction histidine kinase n=1 Tax=Lysobacter enzymogenes TaxID=69 RepID=A0A0S2DL43_LYSEN|nr:signal transduction histidine kinase [Lysobacter enzymogenes]